MGTVMSSFFFLTTYLQEGLGHSALRTGLEFLPGAIVLVFAAHAGQHLLPRFGAKPVLAGGMTLGAGGALLLSGLLTTSHEIGIALVLPILSTIAVNGSLADAFRAATALSAGAALLALAAVRRSDVAPGSSAAFVH